MTSPITISKRILRSADDLPPGTGCWKNCTCYCNADSNRKLTLSSNVVGRDRYDDFYQELSDDNGVFHGNRRILFRQVEKDGAVTRLCEPFIARDSITGNIFRLAIYGTYFNDHDDYSGQNAFFQNMRLLCWRSSDGGHSFGSPQDLTALYLQQFNDARPLISCSHLISCKDGCIRIPCGVCAPGMSSWHCRVMIGKVIGKDINWCWGEVIPAVANRNLFMSEFTIAEVPAGLLAIVRAADNDDENSCRKYFAVSPDGGLHWSPTQELRYTDGSTFYCSDSCGYLLRHSNGRLWYISNIFEHDMAPIYTRTSLSIVEIDDKTLAPKKETLARIDGLENEDNPELAISNFSCYEDRQTGEIVLEAPKAFQHYSTLHDTNLMEYRINFTKSITS